MVIAYKMSPWSWRIMRHMQRQPWVGLPNILAGRFLVPEFIQEQATPDNLAQAVGNVVVDPVVPDRLRRAFTDMHGMLRQNTAATAAAAIVPLLRATS